ncbi:GM19371 [Drosophila sechellia]|uniref:GM19371 n=1 Tax=Drosophila sechellia TaxID=7238 RepID=B4IFP6_DROSE|nr:GM19371 [Drosophila sechellia]
MERLGWSGSGEKAADQSESWQRKRDGERESHPGWMTPILQGCTFRDDCKKFRFFPCPDFRCSFHFRAQLEKQHQNQQEQQLHVADNEKNVAWECVSNAN